MKTIAIIGSTGSIGKTTLKVLSRNRNKFNLIYLAANTNYKKLFSQSRTFKPKKIILLDKKKFLKNKNKNVLSIDELNKTKKKIDYVISGMSSYNSLSINLKLTKISKNLLIANKESIICGGNILKKYAKKNSCKIIPIDSEHHCLDFFLKNFKIKNRIKKIYLVASGGPLLNKKITGKEKVADIIKHPTWKMGNVISVNSSTFANKVLELFEAKILFNIKSRKLSICVEKLSNFHVIIELANNIVFPMMHYPNMEIAISNSLNLPNNYKLNFIHKNYLLKEANIKKFPLINLGYKILNDYSDRGMVIFTILNERLVKSYLNKEIKYSEITNSLVKAFDDKVIINESKKKIKNYSEISLTVNFAENYVF